MTSRDQHSGKPRRLSIIRPITRRDFIDGIAVTAVVAASPRVLIAGDAEQTAVPQDGPDYYPPTLTGMRGSHPGSFEAAHALRDGSLPQGWTSPIDAGTSITRVLISP